MNEIIVVLDCGATNLRAVAVDERGEVVGAASRANASSPQPGGEPGWLIWDLDAVWGRLSEACREVCTGLAADRVRGVVATTWGADGAPVRSDGSLAYPVISWQCPRTAPLVAAIAERMTAWEIYRRTGYPIISFNTLLRWLWLREHAPAALDRADGWLMMPGLINQALCGERSIDPTAGSTTMAMEIAARDWSEPLLVLAGLGRDFFPPWVEPGAEVGRVTAAAAAGTGLPLGTPVYAGGHDTQFALLGAGAGPGQAILSTGTWEILSLRVDRCEPNRQGFEDGVILEADAVPGRWNPQILMIGSGVLEWVRERFYGSLPAGEAGYRQLIAGGERAGVGAGGVMLVPSFVPGTGPTQRHGTQGTLLGLSLTTEPSQIYRAALEGLSFQLREALRLLQAATGFQARGLRVVGGGARNDLWNQLRADVTGLPVAVTTQREATLLGAAMAGFVGAGVFASLENAAEAVAARDEVTFTPSPHAARYDELFARYAAIAPALHPIYSG
jgi:L-fuculokinase